MTGMTIEISAAGVDDLERVSTLLVEAGLPLDGVSQHFRHFLVARAEGAIVGAVGLEPYGDRGLLRSLVVHPRHRGHGVGRMLVEHLLDRTRRQGIILLTETAEIFFASLGFARIGREAAGQAVQASVEFQHACPVSAVCMQKAL
jgi:amino-acid N-acetyltransferase